MNRILDIALLVVVVLLCHDKTTSAWVSTSAKVILKQQINVGRFSHSNNHPLTIRLLSADPKINDETEGIKRTTFDEAGRSLVEEEDTKRMEAMGDYDLNPNVSHLL
jgi:hypothetical protein